MSQFNILPHLSYREAIKQNNKTAVLSHIENGQYIDPFDIALAAETGDIDMLSLIAEEASAPLSFNNNVALLIAIEDENIEMIEFLLKDDNVLQDFGTTNALQEAIRIENTEIIEMIINAPISNILKLSWHSLITTDLSPSIISSLLKEKAFYSRTKQLLESAIKEEREELIPILIQTTRSDNTHFLELAIRRASHSIVKNILLYVSHVPDSFISLAIKRGKKRILFHLLQDGRADPSYNNLINLHIAIDNDQWDMFLVLLTSRRVKNYAFTHKESLISIYEKLAVRRQYVKETNESLGGLISNLLLSQFIKIVIRQEYIDAIYYILYLDRKDEVISSYILLVAIRENNKNVVNIVLNHENINFSLWNYAILREARNTSFFQLILEYPDVILNIPDYIKVELNIPL